MKKCPNCNRTYSDETLNFCLDDGTVLVSASKSVTDENIHRPTEQQTEILPYDQVTEAVEIDNKTDDYSNEKETVVSSPSASKNSEPQIIQQGVSPMFAYLSVGLLALLVLLVGVGIAFWINSISATDTNTGFVSNSSNKTNETDESLSNIELVGKENQPAITTATSDKSKTVKTPEREPEKTPKKTDKEPTPTKSPDETPKPTEPPKEENGKFYVILGSFKNPANAKKRLQLARSKGLPARIINTSNVPGLRSGLQAVVMGPFSKAKARNILGRAKSVSSDAYVKSG